MNTSQLSIKLVYTGKMNFKSLRTRFLTAGFDTSDDLMLQRKLILVTTLQTMVGIICLFFAVYNVMVTHDYAVASFDVIGLLVSLYAAYLLHVKKKLQQSIYLVVIMLFFFLNALSAANQNVSYGIIWNFFYPIFVILLLGHRNSGYAIGAFYAAILTQAYLGIGVWQNGDWDMTSFVRFTFASVVVTYSAYFNEWSLDKSYTELQRVRQREKESAQTYADNMVKMLENKKQLLVDVSHELRTPLSVLKVYLEALEDGVNSNEESYPVLQRKLNQIDRLIQDIYLLSKSDIDQLNMQIESIYISELFADLEISFEKLAKDKNLSLNIINTIEEETVIEGDWQRLIQVYGNLLQNSINYTDSGGRIELFAKKIGKEIEIVVQDSSPGVPESEYEKLFERMYRLDSSRNRSTGGSGLGLSICQAIIGAHQGSINISSSSLGGLKVTSNIPISQETIKTTDKLENKI